MLLLLLSWLLVKQGLGGQGMLSVRKLLCSPTDTVDGGDEFCRLVGIVIGLHHKHRRKFVFWKEIITK